MGRKKKPPASELLESPIIDEIEDDGGGDGTPFDKAYTSLTVTGGKSLELMTRATPKLAQAISVAYTMKFNFHSRYIQGFEDTLMRMHVSMGGKGRSEMVQSLQAGSGVPGEYYDAGNPNKNSFIDIEDEDIPNDPE